MTEKRFTIFGEWHKDNVIDEIRDNTGEFVTIGRCVDLLNENEQLKQELKDYHNAFDCSQCKYQNYDWFDDGDEFEVCDKGNNEAQMDNHSCKDWEEL